MTNYLEIIGKLSILFSLTSTAFALIVLIINNYISKNEKGKTFSNGYGKLFPFVKRLYLFSFLTIVSASIVLLIGFLSNDFSLMYVWQNSSVDLGLFYKISAFWAGQEGSFLFWLFVTSALGFVLFRKRFNNFINWSLFYVLLFKSIVLIILINASPFEAITGTIPTDGRGLNPVLIDFWMVFHPPALFVGYSAMLFPYALSITALTNKDYVGWKKVMFPWIIFGTVFLGIGIILGGYWAYKTLGWGGYWGWDPVENSSLVPWLMSIALLHMFIINLKRGSLTKSCLILSIMTFVFILYSTFLTRSGVLGDFSQHSFGNLGINIYLIILIAIFTIIGMLFFLYRTYFTMIKSPPIGSQLFSREWVMNVTSLLFIIAAAFIIFGTSFPLISKLISNKPGNLKIAYYVNVNLPIALLITFFLLITPVTKWGQSSLSDIIKRTWIPFLISAVITIVLQLTWLSSLKEEINILLLVFLFLSIAVVFTYLFNLRFTKKYATSIPYEAFIHIGMALMFIGIIFSEGYKQHSVFTMSSDETIKVSGYKIKYEGIETFDEEKKRLIFSFTKDGRTFNIKPVSYSFHSKADNTYKSMRKPDIIIKPFKDIYMSAEEPISESVFDLKLKGKSKVDDLTFEFVDYNLSNNKQKGNKDKTPTQKAMTNFEYIIKLKVMYKSEEYFVKPKIMHKKGDVKFVNDKIGETDMEVSIVAINPENNIVRFSVSNLPVEKIKAELSINPGIGFLWLGSVLLTLGGLISFLRRGRQTR